MIVARGYHRVVPRLPTSDGLRARKERHKQRNRLYRIGVVAVGFLLVALGIVLVPLPGPGWLIVALGLGLLALEFDRAERLLVPILDRLERLALEAATVHPLVRAAAVGLTVLGVAGAIAVVVLYDVPYLPG